MTRRDDGKGRPLQLTFVVRLAIRLPLGYGFSRTPLTWGGDDTPSDALEEIWKRDA